MKQLFLIDANSIIHRSFHALPPLTTKDGKPGNALYGLSGALIKLFREDHPDYVAALFDRPEPTFREEKYPEYKATRPPTASELIEQIISAHELFPRFGIRTFEQPGFEADDLIATFIKRFGDEPDLRIVVLTGDLDTLQLVRDDKVVVRVFVKGLSETTTYTKEAVLKRYGLLPNQLADYKAFVGDSSDNVKGVPGIGPKTAVALLHKYGTLENIFAHLDDDPKLKARLGPLRPEADFSKSLVVLEGQAPVPVARLDDVRAEFSEENLKTYFEELGFQSLVKRLLKNGEAVVPKTGTRSHKIGKPPESPAPPQGTMF